MTPLPESSAIKIIDDLALVLYRPRGVFRVTNIIDYLAYAYSENKASVNYNRFTDFNEITAFDINLEMVKGMTEFRKKIIPREKPTKTCIFARTDTAIKISNQYRILVSGEWISVFVSGDLDECADFLGVDKAIFNNV